MDIQVGKKYYFVRNSYVYSGADYRLVGQMCRVLGYNEIGSIKNHPAYDVIFDHGAHYYLYDVELMEIPSMLSMVDTVAKIKTSS